MSQTASLTSQAAITLIRGYQRYVSPHKGFVCAHRVLHQGDSCSQFAASLVAERGWRAAVGSMRERFRACRAAFETLRSDSYVDRVYEESGRKRRKLQSLPSGEPEISNTCWHLSVGGCPCEVIEIAACIDW